MTMLNADSLERWPETRSARLDVNIIDDDFTIPADKNLESRLLKVLIKTLPPQDELPVIKATNEKEAEERAENNRTFQQIRAACAPTAEQKKRYDYIAACFAKHTGASTFCLSKFSLPELCAALTGVRENALQTGIEKKIWINPTATLAIPPARQRKATDDNHLIALTSNAIPQMWHDILTNMPSVRALNTPTKKEKLARAEDRAENALIKRYSEMLDIAPGKLKREGLLPPIDAKNTAKQQVERDFYKFFHAQKPAEAKVLTPKPPEKPKPKR